MCGPFESKSTLIFYQTHLEKIDQLSLIFSFVRLFVRDIIPVILDEFRKIFQYCGYIDRTNLKQQSRHGKQNGQRWAQSIQLYFLSIFLSIFYLYYISIYIVYPAINCFCVDDNFCMQMFLLCLLISFHVEHCVNNWTKISCTLFLYICRQKRCPC